MLFCFALVLYSCCTLLLPQHPPTGLGYYDDWWYERMSVEGPTKEAACLVTFAKYFSKLSLVSSAFIWLNHSAPYFDVALLWL